jgi:hypothetical protein
MLSVSLKYSVKYTAPYQWFNFSGVLKNELTKLNFITETGKSVNVVRH